MPRLPDGDTACDRIPTHPKLVHCPAGIAGLWGFWVWLPEDAELRYGGEFSEPYDLTAWHPSTGMRVLSLSRPGPRSLNQQLDILKDGHPDHKDGPDVPTVGGSVVPSHIIDYEYFGPSDDPPVCRRLFMSLDAGHLGLNVCNSRLNEYFVSSLFESLVLDLP